MFKAKVFSSISVTICISPNIIILLYSVVEDIQIVTDIEEKTFALNKLIEKYAPQSPKLSSSSGAITGTNVLVISIKEMTAKQSPVGGKTVITPSGKE